MNTFIRQCISLYRGDNSLIKIVKIAVLSISSLALVACSSAQKLGIQKFPQLDSETVYVGQFEPEPSHHCQLIKSEQVDYGVKGKLSTGLLGSGSFYDKMAETLSAEAVKSGANYVHVDVPHSLMLFGLDVNALADAKANYYRCSNPPGRK
ncbi:hypothetical protein NX722_21455 [Endozoicomonas gorgoniicola]|uniref:Lipoprotein n=1 Tax=Endozoicomonas gorgoniicola TaxID=1234144 RepID=A0ABT3N0J1_9GAMM|nr:hypothetical protein [Endozoicomonas gorgoniicola]MCW7555144.1 hypothetical protein [Endozoicomonas gorgoniicola]